MTFSYPSVKRVLPLFLMLGMSLGCGAVLPHEASLSITLPEAFSSSGRIEIAQKWWEGFNDPQLNKLVDMALSDNLDFKMALSRLNQMKAVAGLAASSAHPSLGVSGGATWTDANFVSPAITTGWGYSLGLSANYELDLFGKVAAKKKAATLNFRASGEDVSSIGISIISTLAEAWYELLSAREERKLIESQIKLSSENLELLSQRFDRGLIGRTEIIRAKQQLTSIASELPNNEMRIKLSQNQLCALLGLPPAGMEFSQSATLPRMSALPSTGVPSGLLTRRPDIRAARLRMEAKDEDFRSAVAARFPSVSITASSGGSGASVSGIFDNWLTNLGANLFAPLLNGGALKNEALRAEAASRESFHQYAKTILAALSEVENALARIEAQQRGAKSLTRQIELARDALRLTRARYNSGVVGYTMVIASQTELYTLMRREIASNKMAISNRIGLYRALAGGLEVDVK